MDKYRFYKEGTNWYVDLPNWEGAKSDLLMIGGADTMLDIVSNNTTKVTVYISETEFEGSSELTFVKLAEDIGEGAYYNLASYEGTEHNLSVFLCDVTLFVFNKFPEKLFIKNVVSQVEKVDIKYLGIPNICFSLTDKDDKREVEFSKQRMERGFDDSETWSLRDTIGNFMIPRLERYEEIAKGFLKREPEMVVEIESLLNAMKLIARDKGSCIFTDEEQKQVEEGLNNFPKVFMSLWW
jgi:hypothetical protein